ncbi:unnamed protein product [Fraxinus pennsylvanica]|uniref:Transcription repressor n=1 Tax=Fraxinus pennsylvanica TaxID=56036 RepID=A0AAD2A6U2_9LAMI|nr:unnamed protein product [Fraxinus pennsylvanica]
MRFYRMFRSSLISCKSKNTIDDIEDPAFIPKVTQSHQHYQLIKHFLPHPLSFPFVCRPKWPEKLSEERKCLLVSTEIGRKCPPVSPISPFNAHYEFQKNYSEKTTRKTINKKVHSTTKKCDFRDKEEFTTEKCCISNGFKAGSLSRRAQRKIPKESSMTIQEGVKDSLALVKRSSDPYTDFRTSMVEMIVEMQIFTTKELEKKKTRKTINKKVHSTTEKYDFRDKEEFTTEKCGISKGFKAGSLSRRAQRKIPKESSMKIQEGVKDSLAVVKRSSDPYTDFRTSMVEMIVEMQIFTAKELESLLQCFLSLNSYHHHRVIIEVFSEIWEALFVSYV